MILIFFFDTISLRVILNGEDIAPSQFSLLASSSASTMVVATSSKVTKSDGESVSTECWMNHCTTRQVFWNHTHHSSSQRHCRNHSLLPASNNTDTHFSNKMVEPFFVVFSIHRQDPRQEGRQDACVAHFIHFACRRGDCSPCSQQDTHGCSQGSWGCRNRAIKNQLWTRVVCTQSEWVIVTHI